MSDFNIAKNFSKLFHRPEGNHFYNLDGLRAISILWVIGFHCIYFLGKYDFEQFIELRSRPIFAWMKWGFYGVDIFFVISGFIISYLLMKEWKEYGYINIKEFYYRRILRLLPAYYIALLIYAFLDSSNIGNIWANIFYVNNFLTVQDQYMTWAWSLAIEEQFYIIFPLFLLLFLRLNRFQLLILLGLMALAIYIRFYIINYYNMELPPYYPDIDVERFSIYFDNLYDKLYSRFGALLLGVIAAYVYLFTNTKQWLEKGFVIRYALLLIAFVLLLPVIIAKESTDPAALRLPTVKAIVACYPYVFSLSIAYIIFFSLPGKGSHSLLGKFLGMRFWYPIAQLSYSAYLLHPIVILAAYKMFFEAGEYITTTSAILNGILLTILSLGAATILYLTVERPIMNKRKQYRRNLKITGDRALETSL